MRGLMGTHTVIPATIPVQFTERTLYAGGEIGVYRLQLGGVVAFEGRLDETRVRRAMQLLLDAEPVLGCRFVADVVPPVWQRLDRVDSVRLLEVRECDEPAMEAAAFIAEPLDSETDPQVRAAVLRGPSSDVLAVCAGHLAADGGALKQMMYLISEIYRVLGEQPDWTPEPNVDGLRYPMAKAGPLETLRALGQNDLKTPPTSPDWFIPLRGSRGPASYVEESVEPDALRAAAERGKSLGATVNDIIVTALYRALWRLLGATPGSDTPLMITCELRKHLPAGAKTALCNMSSAWWVSVPPMDNEEFDGTLVRVAEATQKWKRSGAGKASSIGIPVIDRLTRKKGLGFARKMMSGMMADAEPTQGAAVLTNIGIIDEQRLDYGSSARISDAWLLPPVSPMGVALGASTYRDRLHFVAGVEFANVSEELVTDILAGTAREIESWVMR